MDLGQFLFLTIENVTFANGRIPEKWFGGRYAIFSLTFRHCEFTEIEKKAFAESAFNVLKLLTFDNVTSFSLESGRFTGIDELSELTFRNTSLVHIDDRFMSQIAKYLYKFEMISASRSTVTVDDLLERTSLPLLWSFHFECARIKNALLSEQTLAALAIVHTLKLIDCEIVAITATAFDRISKSLKILQLQRNHLKTLNEQIFDKLILNRVSEIGLAGNPWICDANVIALAAKLNKNDLPFDISQCMPELLPPESSPPYNSSTTTVSPSIVHCAKSIRKLKEFSIKFDPRTHNIVIKVLPRHSSGSFRLFVMFFSHAIGVKEFKTCTKSKTQKCLGILTRPEAVIKLPLSMNQTNSLHTICLLEELKQSTHPLHCISLARITKKFDQSTWIPTSAQIWLLPTIVVFYLLSFAFGISITFGTFRMRPRLLRGCRRVVIMHDEKSGHSTVVVMPKEWNSNRWDLKNSVN